MLDHSLRRWQEGGRRDDRTSDCTRKRGRAWAAARSGGASVRPAGVVHRGGGRAVPHRRGHREVLRADPPDLATGRSASSGGRLRPTVVEAAADGAEAVATFRRTRPDIVLMDTRMRRMDGIEATRWIPADGQDSTRVAILTVHAPTTTSTPPSRPASAASARTSAPSGGCGAVGRSAVVSCRDL
ncbi:response regulator [Streptomyces sp. NPDC005780]|uniref:response regulator n=1 Tax=Streptomyces sp. NPDC005780 TaxID=3364730 RepID=UPI0036BBF5CA